MPGDRDHRALCDIAVSWLRRPFSAGGHGCNFAVSEVAARWGGGEIPDAIGFRQVGHLDGSVVVEVKTSRADFLADRAKPHRAAGGLGDWRYFMAPFGLLTAADMPPRWGLLEVSERGGVRVSWGAMALGPSNMKPLRWDAVQAQIAAFRNVPDRDAEMSLLVRLLARVGDPEKLNRAVAEARRDAARIARHNDRLRAENADLSRRLYVTTEAGGASDAG